MMFESAVAEWVASHLLEKGLTFILAKPETRQAFERAVKRLATLHPEVASEYTLAAFDSSKADQSLSERLLPHTSNAGFPSVDELFRLLLNQWLRVRGRVPIPERHAFFALQESEAEPILREFASFLFEELSGEASVRQPFVVRSLQEIRALVSAGKGGPDDEAFVAALEVIGDPRSAILSFARETERYQKGRVSNVPSPDPSETDNAWRRLHDRLTEFERRSHAAARFLSGAEKYVLERAQIEALSLLDFELPLRSGMTVAEMQGDERFKSVGWDSGVTSPHGSYEDNQYQTVTPEARCVRWRHDPILGGPR